MCVCVCVCARGGGWVGNRRVLHRDGNQVQWIRRTHHELHKTGSEKTLVEPSKVGPVRGDGDTLMMDLLAETAQRAGASFTLSTRATKAWM